MGHPVFQGMAIGKLLGAGQTHDKEKAALLDQAQRVLSRKTRIGDDDDGLGQAGGTKACSI